MTILLLLVPISVLLLGGAIAAFAWAVRSGQFDDLDTPAVAMLADAPPLSSQPLQRLPSTPRVRGLHRLRSTDSDGAWNWSWPLARGGGAVPRPARGAAPCGQASDADHAR